MINFMAPMLTKERRFTNRRFLSRPPSARGMRRLITTPRIAERIAHRAEPAKASRRSRIEIDQLEPSSGYRSAGKYRSLELGDEGLLQIVLADPGDGLAGSLIPIIESASRLIAIAFARSTIEAMIAPLSKSLR
jgi:hypothetical protein